MLGRAARIAGAAAAGAAGVSLLSGWRGAGPAVPPAESQPASAAPSEAPPAQQREEGDELRLVQVVFRHGARTPLGRKYWRQFNPSWDVCGAAYEGVPIVVTTPDGAPRPFNKDDARQVDLKYEGGCHKGELTLVGQLQARELGEWLRARYVGGGGDAEAAPGGTSGGAPGSGGPTAGFLPPAYAPGQLAAQTTNYQRTVATLRGLLTGLYPGAAAPIPVSTHPELDEFLYSNIHSCERLKGLVQALHRETRERAANPPPELAALQARVQGVLGMAPDHQVDYLDLHDALTTLITHGKAHLVPPQLLDPALREQIERQATAKFMHIIAPSTDRRHEVLRLGLGRLIQLMLERMEAAAGAPAGGAAPRLFLYSGHDSSIMPLLASLGKHVELWPAYASSVILELWHSRRDGRHYVQVLYNRERLPLTELCGAPTCDLQTLKDEVLRPFLLTRHQHAEECSVQFMHDRAAGKHMELSQRQDFQEEREAPAEGAPPPAARAPAAQREEVSVGSNFSEGEEEE